MKFLFTLGSLTVLAFALSSCTGGDSGSNAGDNQPSQDGTRNPDKKPEDPTNPPNKNTSNKSTNPNPAPDDSDDSDDKSNPISLKDAAEDRTLPPSPAPAPLSDPAVMAQLQDWTVDQIPLFPTAEVKKAPLELIRELTSAQLQALSVDQVSALTDAQILELGKSTGKASLRDLKDEQLISIRDRLEKVFSSLSPLEKINALTRTQCENVHIRFFPFRELYTRDPRSSIMTREQAQALKPEVLKERYRGKDSESDFAKELFLHISELSEEQIAALHPFHMNFFYTIPWMKAENVPLLSLRQLGACNNGMFSLMLPEQIQKMTVEQLKWLDGSMADHLSVSFYSSLFPAITRKFVKTMQPQELEDLFAGTTSLTYPNLVLHAVLSYADAFSTEQIKAIPSLGRFQAEDMKKIKHHVTSLSPGQIKSIPSKAILGFDGWLKFLQKPQVEALTSGHLTTISDDYSARTNFAPLVRHLTPSQLNGTYQSFFREEILTNMETTQLQSLSATKLNEISNSDDKDRLGPYISSLLPSQIQGLNFRAIRNTLHSGNVKNLSKEQFEVLDYSQLSELFANRSTRSSVTSQQIGSIKPDVIKQIRKGSVEDFFAEYRLWGLVKEQVEALSGEQLNAIGAANLSFASNQLTYLTPDQIKGIWGERFKNLTTDDSISSLTQLQIEALSQDHVQALCKGYSPRCQKLKPQQVQWIKPEVIKVLKSDDDSISRFIGWNISTFTQEQFQALSATQLNKAKSELALNGENLPVTWVLPTQIAGMNERILQQLLTSRERGALTTDQLKAIGIYTFREVIKDSQAKYYLQERKADLTQEQQRDLAKA